MKTLSTSGNGQVILFGGSTSGSKSTTGTVQQVYISTDFGASFVVAFTDTTSSVVTSSAVNCDGSSIYVIVGDTLYSHQNGK